MGVAVDGSTSYIPGDENPLDDIPSDEEEEDSEEDHDLHTPPQHWKQEDQQQLPKPTQYCKQPQQEDEEPSSQSHGVPIAAAQRHTNTKECSHGGLHLQKARGEAGR